MDPDDPDVRAQQQVAKINHRRLRVQPPHPCPWWTTRLKTTVAMLYALTAAALATSAGALAGPVFANYGQWMAYAVQAAITAAVALPAGYWSDTVTDSVRGLLANDNCGRS